MTSLKRLAEWYLGFPPVAGGEETNWRIESSAPWPTGLPVWVGVLLVIGLLAVAVSVYLKETRTRSAATRVTLLVLRLLVLLGIVLLLTGTTLSIDRVGLPDVVILIDDSLSMGLDDRYNDEAIRERVKKLLADAETRPTRLALGQAVLTGDDATFLTRLLDRHRLRVYRFAEVAEPLGAESYVAGDSLDDLVTTIEQLEPEAEKTRPGPAVRSVLSDLRGRTPAGVLIISDGITSTTEADRLTAITSLAETRGVPLYTLGIGSEDPARDLDLYDLKADEIAFVDDPVLFSASLKSFGYEGETARVVLRQTGEARALAETEVVLPADGTTLPVELTFIPRTEGEFDFELVVEPKLDEIDRANNRQSQHLSVRRERIRVLLVETVPRWEYRYLKSLLERDPTITLNVLLLGADGRYASQDESAKPLGGRFPVNRDTLLGYDVVIWGDVDPRAVPEDVLTTMTEWVSERGGGLVLIGGELHMPFDYAGTPMEPLLPMRLGDASPAAAQSNAITEPFTPRLTLPAQRASRLFRFGESARQSLRIWNDLPELRWMQMLPPLKETATVWATHPSRVSEQGPLPLLIRRPVGRGLVIYHATDELWLWRKRVGDLYYSRYWIPLLRYLTLSRRNGQRDVATLETDRERYARGERVSLWVRFLDERTAPDREVETEVTVLVQREGGPQRVVRLTRSEDDPLLYEGEFGETVPGSYRAWVATPTFPKEPPAATFRVLSTNRELVVRKLDRGELSRAASQTEGRYYTLADIDRFPDDLPPGRPVTIRTQDPIPLWSRPEVLLLLVLLLGTEWVLRKRTRLV